MKVVIENLHFSYPGKEVLKGISLNLEEKEIMCIVGPNGSGKSTLVKCIEGLQTPCSGGILFDYVDASEFSRLEIARKIGYVPQSSNHLFSMSVFDTILMGRKPYYSWRSSDEDIDIVADILKMMELESIAMVDYNNLSGGQQQRVLIARALAQKPELLLLDEPTSALDISHQLEVMEIIQNLVQNSKIAAMMVIHDLNLASRYADHIVMLHEGRVYANGSSRETLTESNIEQVYGVEVNIHSHNDTLSVTPIRRVKRSDSDYLQQPAEATSIA